MHQIINNNVTNTCNVFVSARNTCMNNKIWRQTQLYSPPITYTPTRVNESVHNVTFGFVLFWERLSWNRPIATERLRSLSTRRIYTARPFFVEENEGIYLFGFLITWWIIRENNTVKQVEGKYWDVTKEKVGMWGPCGYSACREWGYLSR